MHSYRTLTRDAALVCHTAMTEVYLKGEVNPWLITALNLGERQATIIGHTEEIRTVVWDDLEVDYYILFDLVVGRARRGVDVLSGEVVTIG